MIATNYSDMTEEQARNQLEDEYSPAEVEKWDAINHIYSAKDVLYYSDAYGNLDDAILLQGWDKSLPSRAHQGLLDSGLDIIEAINCHDMNKERCPNCGCDMWEFEIYESEGYNSTYWVDEYGNVGNDVEFVSDPAGLRIWNAAPESDHAPCLCMGCSIDSGYTFRGRYIGVFYGDTGEISGFSCVGNLIRWDFESAIGFRNNADWTDLYGVPEGGEEIGKAFAEGNLIDYFSRNDWRCITHVSLEEHLELSQVRDYKIRNRYRDIVTEWSQRNEPLEDTNYTYIIDTTAYKTPNIWLHQSNRDDLIAKIVDAIKDEL